MYTQLTQSVIDAQSRAKRALENVQKIDTAIKENSAKLIQAKADLQSITTERDAIEAERAMVVDEKVAASMDKKVSAMSKAVDDQAVLVARLERISNALLVKGREHDDEITAAKAHLRRAMDEFLLLARDHLAVEFHAALAPFMSALHKALAVGDALGDSVIWLAMQQSVIADPSNSIRPIIAGGRRNNEDGSHTELVHAWRADSQAVEIFEALKEPNATLSKFSGHKSVSERLAISVPYVRRGYEVRGFDRAMPVEEAPQSLVGRIA